LKGIFVFNKQLMKRKINKVLILKIKPITFLVMGVFFSLPALAVGQESGQVQNPFGGANTLIGFIEFILNNIVLPIGAVIAVLFLVFSGFLFVTARGEEEKLKLAKKTFLWTVVGIAVLLGSVAIANAIQATLCQIAPGTPGCGGPPPPPPPP
jgi:hypothetical protein